MRERARWGVIVLAASFALGACGDAAEQAPPEADLAAAAAESSGHGGHGRPLRIVTLSNRADLVSGGDIRVEIDLPSRASSRFLRVFVVRAGARDVSGAFSEGDDGRVTGVITGLRDGPNLIIAFAPGAGAAFLVVTNHPIGGSVLSGPQVLPFVCATPVAIPATPDSAATNASGLGTNAVDVDCNIATETRLYYKTTTPGCANVLPDPNPPATPPANGCFRPYDPAAPPADLASTTNDAGVTVPYIVRRERGTMNRGIFDIAVLWDPAVDAPSAGWNHKVVYSFGASTGQPRRQFRSSQSWTDDAALSRGFMVAVNSMSDSALNSNRVVMSETVMMMREHIGDTYGEVRYIIGNGCSGGSINQLTAASTLPGALDGIQPTCTYPDSETTAIEVADCELLVRFYVKPDWAALMSGLTQEQINAKKAAINGHRDQLGCQAWFNLFAPVGRAGNYIPDVVLNPTTGAIGPLPGAALRNNCQLPLSQVYDPVTNPDGVRCTGQDHAVAIWGKVPGTNRARSTRDNVGVQYGLAALRSGAITAEEFVVLNEKIGGADFDLNFTAERSAADLPALRIAYESGIVSDGDQLGKTPMIDLRGWDDSSIHHIYRSFSLRARIERATGHHENHVMWRYGTGLIAPAASGLTLQSFLTIDRWVAGITADHSRAPIEEKIVTHKPAEAFDFCYLTSDTTFSTKVTDFAVCDTDPFLKPHQSPRQVAGGPLAENVLKCQLERLDARDYRPAELTASQIARLRAVFPDGVCDWHRRGVGQRDADSPRDYTFGPGGRDLSRAPESRPLFGWW